jgi:hypothetical protein
MPTYSGFWSAAIDETGAVVASASVSVYDAETVSLATIYSNASGTVLANPITTDSNGRYSFYVAPGRYYCIISKTGYTSWTSAEIFIPGPVDDTSENTSKNKLVSNKMMFDLNSALWLWKKIYLEFDEPKGLPHEVIDTIMNNLKTSVP